MSEKGEDLVLKHRPESVYGLPKVYFCCHPLDFEDYFEEISGEILRHQNCSFWYHEGKVEYSEDLLASLGEMNLFVIPVTQRFLQEGNPALEIEFEFAVENGIPVLPLMQEQGLGRRFSARCGSLQYLNQFDTDRSCIEFSEKLEKFLASVLVGDELAERIRGAFLGKIFLSYRKKDRRLAQELMRRIHENDFCRDVAIWYDEFLVPGEEFHGAIEEALSKSDLFVLTVTENLVNETNYVSRIEFPKAKEYRKPILPCEMEKTNRERLGELFSDLPDCTDCSDADALALRLRSHFPHLGSGKEDTDEEHLYLIGLAYLNGIDVEVDRPRGLHLITTAAEREYIPAVVKLVEMYTDGDGVKADPATALTWRKRLYALTRHEFERTGTFDAARGFVRACFDLARSDYELDLYDDAIERAKELSEICHSLLQEMAGESRQVFLYRHQALSRYILGQSHHIKGDLPSARDAYALAIASYEKLLENDPDAEIVRDAAIVYLSYAQLCKVEAKYHAALEYLAKALLLQEGCADRYVGDGMLVDQIRTHTRMSEIYRILFENEKAVEHCLAGKKILDGMISIHGIKKYFVLKNILLFDLAEALRGIPDLDGALDVYRESEELDRMVQKKFGEFSAASHAKRYFKISQIHFQKRDYEKAISYGEKALEVAKDTFITKDGNTATGGTDELTACVLVGMAYIMGRGDFQAGLDFYRRSEEMAVKIEEMGILSSMPDLVLFYSTYGDCLQNIDRMPEANRCVDKAMALYRAHLAGSHGFRELCTAFSLFLVCGRNLLLRDEISAEKALEHLQEAERIYERIIAIRPGHEANLLRDYTQLCQIAAACYLDLASPRAKEYFQKVVVSYDRMEKDSYALSDWDTLANACYYMYQMAAPFKRNQWKNRLIDACREMQRRFPNRYREAYIYKELGDTEAFE